MGSPTSLVLECRHSSSTTTAANSGSCRNFSNTADDQACEIQRLEEYLNALEEERRKIEAFKRELPFCMELLHDTIQAYKEKLAFFKPSSQTWSHIQQKSNSDDADSKPESRIIIEEFLPVNRAPTCTGRNAEEVQQRPNWMKEAGLVDTHTGSNERTVKVLKSTSRFIREFSSIKDLISAFLCTFFFYLSQVCEPEPATKMNGSYSGQGQAFSNAWKPVFHSKTSSGGAFTPFNRDKPTVIQPTARPGALNLADLAFTPKDSDVSPLSLDQNPGLLENMKQKENVIRQAAKEAEMKVSVDKSNGSNNVTPARKARRCWSPELHRRFVNALNQLGGPQVATPKQIRELMKVEGLTNDEVKSHLQKYRLHTRRPNASSAAMSTHPPQVVVLGSIWVPPPDQSPALYGSLQPRSRIYRSTTTPSEEMCSQLESPEQINVHFSSAPAYSQSSLQGHVEHNGQLPPLIYSHSDDAGREESVGDDRISANSSSKAFKDLSSHHSLPAHHQDETVDKSPDGSMYAQGSHCTSENGDDTEIEDERDCATSV